MNVTEELPPSAQKILAYRQSAWRFASEAVYTLDQVDKTNPTKKYPTDDSEKAPYLKYIMEQIVNERLLAIVKHRRMIITWTACVVILWDAMLRLGRFNALISKKEEDSDELVRRCKFIYENIPTDVMPYKPEMKYSYCALKFPELNSEIRGLAQGPDQLRQYTCSRIIADEMAFWPTARQTFVAMKPTLDGGGQVALISTRFPGFFKQLIEDTLDD